MNVTRDVIRDLWALCEASEASDDSRRLARRSPFRILALGLTGLAIPRLVEATTFTKSPVEVVALAIAAAVCWIAYGWHTRWLQQRAVLGQG